MGKEARRSRTQFTHDMITGNISRKLNNALKQGLSHEDMVNILKQEGFINLIRFYDENIDGTPVPKRLEANIDGQQVVLMDIRVKEHAVRVNPESDQKAVIDVSELDTNSGGEDAPTKGVDLTPTMHGVVDLVEYFGRNASSITLSCVDAIAAE